MNTAATGAHSLNAIPTSTSTAACTTSVTTSRSTRPAMMASLLTGVARNRSITPMYSDYSRPLRLEHHLRLCLPADPGPAVGPGRTVELIFFRGPGPDFSQRDRTLLALLRPHLHQAYLDAERRRRGTPPLTRRHKDTVSNIVTEFTPLIAAATEAFRPDPDEARQMTRGRLALVDGTLWPC
jgi:hypothetical protein